MEKPRDAGLMLDSGGFGNLVGINTEIGIGDEGDFEVFSLEKVN